MAHFSDQIVNLIGRLVRLGRGGPDERRGILEAVKDDYLTLLLDDGSRVHYPLHHLRSLTEINGGSDTQDGSGSFDDLDPVDVLPDRFAELMQSFLGLKIQVYDHGPESAAGFVFEVGEDFVKLVTGPDEMVHYAFFHIRSVRLARRQQQQDGSGNKSGSSDESGSGSGNESGSGRGRSSGDRTGSRGRTTSDRTGNRGRSTSDRTGGRGRSRNRGKSSGRGKSGGRGGRRGRS